MRTQNRVESFCVEIHSQVSRTHKTFGGDNSLMSFRPYCRYSTLICVSFANISEDFNFSHIMINCMNVCKRCKI